jgi:hypothetical protein
MLESECVVGAKVICMFPGDHVGKIGYISEVRYYQSYFDTYDVKDDNGDPIGYRWRNLDSWDIYTGLTAKPLTGFTAIKQLSKECPCGINRKDCIYHNE